MDSFELAEDLRVFLRDHVETYEKLEVLLLLANDRETRWTIDSIASRLGLSASSLEEALDGLRANGILECRGEKKGREFVYQTAGASVGAAVEKLVQAYKGNRLDVIRTMNANAIERVRNSAIRTFADAFRVRRGDRDG